jgi:exosortase B
MTIPQAYKDAIRRSWPLWLGLAALYVPMFAGLATTVWNTEEQGHGPIIACVVLYLFWQRRQELLAAGQRGNRVTARVLMTVGLLLYVVGRSQDILLFEVGSLLWILTGVLLMAGGRPLLRQVWFPLFFICFMLPLPSGVVDTVTMPMKFAVSYVVEHVLYALGYPIARAGVTLHIGQFVLLVADACAGLQTLFTLEAIGLLYMNVVRSTSLVRNAVLALLIVPISFMANVIRVIALVLITYYFGDAAGQGFLHGFAGMVLFLSALLLTLFVDTLLRSVSARHVASGTPAEQPA